MSVYKDFLELLDFSEADIAGSLDDWKAACSALGLTEEDVRRSAEEWIPKYWDLSLHGVRKCLGAYIRELIEISRFPRYAARGDRIIYSNIPSCSPCVYANKVSGGDKVHVAAPDFLITSVLNAFFHKSTVLSRGERSCMNPLCSHCGLNRMGLECRYKELLVKPAVTWNWGLFCDESPKSQELTESNDPSWVSVFTTLPRDAAWGEREWDNAGRYGYLAKQLRIGQGLVAGITGVPVTEEHVAKALDEYVAYMGKYEKLVQLVSSADPQPIGGNDLVCFAHMDNSAFDTGFKYLNEAIDTMLAEVEGRVARGEGPLPANSPRMAFHFLPFCVPWVCKAFEENGVNLCVNEFFAPASKLREVMVPGDVYTSIARQWLCNPSAVNTGTEVDMVSDILSHVNVDGSVYGFFSFDRWIGGLQKTMIKIVEERTGIPHYYLEGEFWNDERYSLDNRITRIQNIAYTVKINHMMNGVTNAKN